MTQNSRTVPKHPQTNLSLNQKALGVKSEFQCGKMQKITKSKTTSKEIEKIKCKARSYNHIYHSDMHHGVWVTLHLKLTSIKVYA